MGRSFLYIFFLAFLYSCSSEITDSSEREPENSDVFVSTYNPSSSGDVLIRGGKILTGTGEELEGVDILIRDNMIQEISKAIKPSSDALVIDAEGKWITPGIIDIHSHMGVYPAPSLRSNSDGNEATSPVTPHVWAEHSFWTQDTQMPLALKGGTTTFHVLPGSANLFGGRGVTLKNVWSKTVQGMKFPGAPYTLKMACGENPKRVYGSGPGPSTRMGNVAGYRAEWIKAKEYKDNKDQRRDLKLDTLQGVLEGEILIQNHCYRGEEMAVMIDVAKEFNYKITAFHHAVEAYKVADMLDQAKGGTGCAIVHSDSAIGIQRLNQEAAKAMAAGIRAGFDIPRKRAIQWITKNPAKALGIDDRVGTLEKGKMADLVMWDSDPFSVYAKTELVMIDGIIQYDSSDPSTPKPTDFELGIISPDENRL